MVHEVTEAMTSALCADPDIYERSLELVHTIASDQRDADGWASGAPIVRACPTSWLVDRVSTHGRCVRFSRRGEWSPCPPPNERVVAVRERGEWPGIRRLDSVIETPFARPDGSICQTPGWDEATRVLYLPSGRYPEILLEPTRTDAEIAYLALADVFRDFPYASESHRSATIAAILTLVSRPAILGSIPCWAFDASGPRQGKSLQTDVVSLIATGRRASRMTFPPSDEELEKIVSSYAISGARIVPFDNVDRAFGGAALDKVITATDTVDLRLLGSSVIRTFTWRALVIASGNGLDFRGDMLPRVLAPRLESPLERPEEREGLRDLRAYAAEHRERLVAHALTIVRAFVVAGRPGQAVPRWGGFDEWVALIASALVWAGAPDPQGARRGGADDEDATRSAERALVVGWDRVCGERVQEGISTTDAVALLYPSLRRDEQLPPDGHDGVREAIELLTHCKQGMPPTKRALGAALSKLKGRNIGGKRLLLLGETHGIRRWGTR